jgi:hypothetical protein
MTARFPLIGSLNLQALAASENPAPVSADGLSEKLFEIRKIKLRQIFTHLSKVAEKAV